MSKYREQGIDFIAQAGNYYLGNLYNDNASKIFGYLLLHPNYSGMTLQDLIGATGISKSGVSGELRQLLSAGKVSCKIKRESKQRYYKAFVLNILDSPTIKSIQLERDLMLRLIKFDTDYNPFILKTDTDGLRMYYSTMERFTDVISNLKSTPKALVDTALPTD